MSEAAFMRCVTCLQGLPESSFYLLRRGEAKRQRSCIACDKKRVAAWGKRNPERIQLIEARRSSRKAASTRQWQKQHRAHLNEYMREWRKTSSSYRRRVSGDRRHYGNRPAWANQFFIKEIYSLARLRTQKTGIRWEVDHIVPIRHKHVSGLHVERNLRVVPMLVNRTKGNRSWPGMEWQKNV